MRANHGFLAGTDFFDLGSFFCTGAAHPDETAAPTVFQPNSPDGCDTAAGLSDGDGERPRNVPGGVLQGDAAGATFQVDTVDLAWGDGDDERTLAGSDGECAASAFAR